MKLFFKAVRQGILGVVLASTVFAFDVQKFGGIGVTLLQKGPNLTVSGVIPGSPAFSQGLKIGDIISHIDGQDVTSIDLETAVSYMRGDIGQELELSIKRDEVLNHYSLERVSLEVRSEKSSEIFEYDMDNSEILSHLQAHPSSLLYHNSTLLQDESLSSAKGSVYSVQMAFPVTTQVEQASKSNEYQIFDLHGKLLYSGNSQDQAVEFQQRFPSSTMLVP